uniref:Membrane protein, palmitoylated 4a (MAGUK p55 subfamily member 4) n=1 Tax=Scophthalmus maximus TaxID=52904 RepID=A0A8D3AFG7_SCOMX
MNLTTFTDCLSSCEGRHLNQILCHKQTNIIQMASVFLCRNVGGAQLLQELLGAPWLHALLQMYECLLQFKNLTPGPILPYASGLSHEVHTQTHTHGVEDGHRPSAEARELYGLLGSPHMQGATIRRDEDTGGIYIARVIHGGLADRSGLLHPGDLVVEVNGHPVGGLDPEQVIQMLIHSQGTILFKVIPKAAQSSSSQKPVYMRAMVDYFPQQDSSIPCPDAGMAFSRGDLLEVVDQSDGQWWQARKLPCAVSCAGLIPSASMLKSKHREQWWCEPLQVHTCIRPCEDAAASSSSSSSLLSPTSRHRAHICVTDMCFSLCGQGLQEGRYLVLSSSVKMRRCRSSLFSPDTTRPMGAGEQTGREYHFVTKELFEYMVCNHRFVEYGEYRGHLYGTSTDAIDDVLKRGRMCVIDVEPHSIQPLRTRKLKPYVIFIKAPGPERLRQTRRHARLITNCSVNRAFTDDFVELEEASRLMEAKYKHFFDCVLVNDDLQDACMQLCSVIQQAQEEPQWIPVSWGRPEE